MLPGPGVTSGSTHPMHGEPLQLRENADTRTADATGVNVPIPNNSRGEKPRVVYIAADAPVAFLPVDDAAAAQTYAQCTLLPTGTHLLVHVGGFSHVRFICKATLSAEVSVAPLDNF